jgi:hypothetical protein
VYVETGRVRDGVPVLMRVQKFVWRNRDQVTSAIADGIGAGEIAAIRAAMHGVPIAPAQTRAERDASAVSKMYPAP